MERSSKAPGDSDAWERTTPFTIGGTKAGGEEG